MEEVILELMDFSHIRRCFCEAHNVQFAETVQVELTDEAANVCRFEHRIWWIQEFLLKLVLKVKMFYLNAHSRYRLFV